MGHKANLITLRNVKKDILILEENSKILIPLLSFLKLFTLFLKKKNVLICQTYYKSDLNKCFLTFHLFFFTKKSNKLKKKKLKKKQKNLFLKKSKLVNLFNNFLTKYTKNLFFFKFINLNLSISIPLAKNIFKFFQPYLRSIFNRRYTLYSDFVKVACLIAINKVTISTLLFILSITFKNIHKKLHGRFLSFLVDIFKFLTNHSEFKIKGIKYLINGKMKGKLRASATLINIGGVPTQPLSKYVDYSMCHTYTRLGAFGMRLWIYRN